MTKAVEINSLLNEVKEAKCFRENQTVFYRLLKRYPLHRKRSETHSATIRREKKKTCTM